MRKRSNLIIALTFALGCSSGGSGLDGSGGSPGTGGANGTGGATATGGSLGSGGAGGASATGGSLGSGGASATGGSSGTGGQGGGAPIGAGGSGGASATGGHVGQGTGGVGGAGGTAEHSGTGGTSAGTGGAGVAGNSGAAGSGAAGKSGSGYAPCPTTAGTACAILPLGDSITEGWLPTGGVGGYRVQLFSDAVSAGKNVTFVGSQTSSNAPNTVQNQTFPKHHEGHDGYTISGGSGSSGIAGSITDQAVANYHPNIVLLMIGTNDVNGNIDTANAPARLGKLIDEITTDSPAVLVVVASIIPINGGNNQNAITYNAAIPSLVSSRASAGKHVIFVDNYAAFAKDPNYTTTEMSNYLHPNAAGYAVLGDSFYGAIKEYLP